MKLLPAKGTIICTEPTESTSSGGLIISSDEKSAKPTLGLVYAVGEGKLPVPIKVGDTMIFRRYADNRIMVKGVEYNFINFKDIVGIISDEKSTK